MDNIHFLNDLDGKEIIVSILDLVVSLAGPNYKLPYSSDNQPSDGTKSNTDDLLQYQLPGGTALSGYAEPSQSESMGTAINSMLITLAPFLSAYGLILPILGVIIGIIQVLCALMNPWSIRKAVKKLKKKWIPPFLSIFPPLAGVVVIISTIKAILAIVFHILSTLLPMIMLIVHDVKALRDVLISGDGNLEQALAIREKLLTIITEIVNQLGILAVIKPIIDIIMLILKLMGKKPCKKKKKKKFKDPLQGGVPGASVNAFIAAVGAAAGGVGDPDEGVGDGDTDDGGIAASDGVDLGENFDLTTINRGYDEDEDDSSCCDDDVCPPELKSPPGGRGFLLPTFFADSPPNFAWRIIPFSNTSKIKSLRNYMQNFKSQLDSQLDEPISEAKFAGQSGETAHFTLTITGRRGDAQIKEIPIAKIDGSGNMYVIDPSLVSMRGAISYNVVVNWDMLIAHNVVAIGCDPEIEGLNDGLDNIIPDLDPVIITHPETQSIGYDFDNMVNSINNLINALGNIVKQVIFDSDYGILADIVISSDGIISPDLGLFDGYLGLLTPNDNRIIAPLTEVSDLGTINVLTPSVVGPGELAVTPIIVEQHDSLDIGDNDLGLTSPTTPVPLIAATNPALPPYDNQLGAIDEIIDGVSNLLLRYADNLKNKLGSIVSRATHGINSGLDVNKHLVRAGEADKAIIYVTPRDATGTPLLKNLPEGVDIDIDIFSTFGDVGEQSINKKTGVVTADLTSLLPGDAVVTAKVNTEYIKDFDGEVASIRELDVKFISDATMPKRRLVSKPRSVSKKHSTVATYEREPGGK